MKALGVPVKIKPLGMATTPDKVVPPMAAPKGKLPKGKVIEDIAKDISRAKIQLLLTQPFFGNMATGLIIILTDENNHSWCNTAATDGRRLYMNVYFVARLTADELLFVVAHEVLHVVYDHLSRRQGRDPEYYNMAADYVINDTLVMAEIGVMPEIGLHDKQYHQGLTSEQVYDMLIANGVEIEMPLDQHMDGEGNASGNGEDGDGTGEESDGSGKPMPGGGSGRKIKVRIQGKDGPPVLSKEELDEIRADVLSRAIQAVQAADAQENAGCVPLGVRRMIQELTEPKMDWRSLLDNHVRSQLKADYTFAKLSRYDMGGGFIFPAEDDDTMTEADIWIDASGSMGGELLREILSEVKGIMQSFGQFKLRVGFFDTEAYTIHEFTEANADDLDTIECEGGGGTVFSCFWNRMKDEGRVPERLVVFTDGYPAMDWGEGFENYCDTLWVIHGGNRQKAPFGLTVWYEDAQK